MTETLDGQENIEVCIPDPATLAIGSSETGSEAVAEVLLTVCANVRPFLRCLSEEVLDDDLTQLVLKNYADVPPLPCGDHADEAAPATPIWESPWKGPWVDHPGMGSTGDPELDHYLRTGIKGPLRSDGLPNDQSSLDGSFSCQDLLDAPGAAAALLLQGWHAPASQPEACTAALSDTNTAMDLLLQGWPGYLPSELPDCVLPSNEGVAPGARCEGPRFYHDLAVWDCGEAV